MNNYAFIDGQNLNLGIQEQGWRLDLRRFRVYLAEKFQVEKAYYFIGYIEGNSDLYASLQSYGYILIFKPTFRNKDGKIKGNCDAELVLQAMIDYDNYDQAVVVSGDGDFQCLVKYLAEQSKLRTLIAPNMEKYSVLLKKPAAKRLIFMNDLKQKLGLKKKNTH
jgi:uncharacterized LabA/DUF88 family protein